MKLASHAALGASLLAIAAPALAHHSFAMFDPKQTYTVQAVVTEFQWTNPHSWLEIEVPDGKGAHKNFHHLSLEMNALSGLRSIGWSAHTVNPGDKVQVVYHPMRDGSAAGQVLEVKLANGKALKAQ